MQINTKYNVGDFVYAISKGTKTIQHTCKTCTGTGNVVIGEGSFLCPDCHGNKTKYEVLPNKWRVYSENCGTIGQVEVKVSDPKYNIDDKIRYMLSSTGVGTGTIWNEDALFLTNEEAQVECDRHNGENSNG